MAVAKAVEDLTKAFRRLPGVGPKTAQRYVFQLLARDRKGATDIANALQCAVDSVSHCRRCNNFSETPICSICNSPARDQSQICIVETPADLNSFEEAGVYRGLYFVLMGRISPMEGIGPDDLNITELLEILKTNPVNEIILATNITLEGDATADYLAEVIAEQGLKTTRLARGLPLGGELEYMDKGTLIEAFHRRVPS